MRRRVLTSIGKPLPYDAEIEYLEAHSGPYIDTLLKGKETTSVDIIFQYTTTIFNDSTRGCFGDSYALTPGNTPSIMVGLYTDGKLLTYHYNRLFWADVYCGTGEHHVLMKNGECVLDGLTRTQPKSSSFETMENLLVFAYGQPSQRYMYGRIKKCTIAEDGIAVRDLIPVRFTNESGVSEGAMYDRVSGQLFRNAGTGAFVIGPDKA